ncbi:MAG: transposase [Gemmataceae bacterium]
MIFPTPIGIESKTFLPEQPKDPGVTVCEQDNRFFLNVILFVAKTGLPWRDLPESMGHWNSG